MQPLLSFRMGIGESFVGPSCRSSRRSRNQVACFAASAEAMYSASVVGKATVGCWRLFQATTPPYTLKT
jgi:hypothetical protein